MKSTIPLVALFTFGLSTPHPMSRAADLPNVPFSFAGPALSPEPAAYGYIPIELGQHYTLWTQELPYINEAGALSNRASLFVQFSPGLNRWQGEGWVAAAPELVVTNGGIMGRGAGHCAFFTGSSLDPAPCQVQMPSGQWFKTRFLGLAYQDVLTGTNVFIAQVKESAPQVAGAGRVVFPEALDSMAGNLQYVFTRSGVEQDLVLLERPPRPEEVAPGLNAASTWLIVITEIIEAPEPVVQERAEGGGAGLLEHPVIDFGPMRLVPGRAFGLQSGSRQEGVRVSKRYEVANGRRFIVERVRYLQVESELSKLPVPAAIPAHGTGSGSTTTGTNVSHLAKTVRWFVLSSLPPGPKSGGVAVPPPTGLESWHRADNALPGRSPRERPLSVLSPAKGQTVSSNQAPAKPKPAKTRPELASAKGFVLDWELVYGVDWNFTCQYTWLVDGPCHLASARFEPGDFLKFNPGSGLYLDGPFVWSEESECEGELAALLTSVNDNDPSHGEPIAWGSGSPQPGDYGPALALRPEDLPVATNHIIVLYAQPGLVSSDALLPTTRVVPIAAVAAGSLPSANTVAAATALPQEGAGLAAAQLSPEGMGPLAPGSNPPYVCITNPANQAVFSAPATIYIQAVATNAVTNVQFFRGVVLLGQSAGPAFSWTWTNAAAGLYSLTAVAYSTNGLCGTSAPVNITVSGSCGYTFAGSNDFTQGFFLNLNSTNAAGQLQLNAQPTPLSYVNVSCAGRGTLLRIDSRGGQVVGEYRTAPQGKANYPSHVAVDRYGNTWVANWDEGGNKDHTTNGSVTRIGVVIGGTRGDVQKDAQGRVTNFTANPFGHYLQPPFDYCTAVDRDGDGYIKTSAGLADILNWPTNSTSGTAGRVQDAEDECIITYARPPATLICALAVDGQNNLWAGGSCDGSSPDFSTNSIISAKIHSKLSGVTGQALTNLVFANGSTHYGGFDAVIGTNGMLWSVSPAFVSGDSRNLVTYNPATSVTNIVTNPRGNFALAVDPQSGNVWITGYTSNRVAVYSPTGTYLTNYYHGDNNAGGLAFDDYGHVWIAHRNAGKTVGHLLHSGVFLGNVSVTNGTASGSPSDVCVDSQGKIWAVSLDSSDAFRIDPNAGPTISTNNNTYHLGAVDRYVSLGTTNAQPDALGDLTGHALLAVSDAGVWDEVHDSQASGQHWNSLTWNASTTDTNQIRVEFRAGDTYGQLLTNGFSLAQDSAALTNTLGRYLEVRVTLLRPAGTTNSPWFQNLTLACSNAVPPQVSLIWPEDGERLFLPDTLLLAAQAYAPDGDISKVEFFANGTKVGEDTLGWGWDDLFSLDWTNATSGACTLTAVATDSHGLTATSSVVNVTLEGHALVKGINLNGPAVNIEGNPWLSYAQALTNGFSVSNAFTDAQTYSFPLVPPADSDTTTMLQSLLRASRLPSISQQTTNPVTCTFTSGAATSYVTITLSNRPSGSMVSGTNVFPGWCIERDTLYTSGAPYTSMLYYSCGLLDPRFTQLELNLLNYILNHKHGGTVNDIQNALWTVLDRKLSPDYTPTATYNTITNDAYLNGANFVPGTNDEVAVIADPGPLVQPFALEIAPSVGNKAIGFTMTQTNLTNGTYYVCLWLAENAADYSRSLKLKVQGTNADAGVGNMLLGQWTKLGPYAAGVTNGALSIEVDSPALGDPIAMGLAFYSGAIISAQPPAFQLTPTNLSLCSGLTATFAITNLTGTAPLTNAWYKDGLLLAGQTNLSLEITNVTGANAGTYSAVVSNAAGSATNSATLTVLTTISAVGPANTNTCPGGSASLCTIVVSGSGPFSYTWTKDGLTLTNQTGSCLTITNASTNDAGLYCVRVAGACGGVTNCATLTVWTNLSILSPPADTNALPGGDASFSVTAAGRGLSYQWFQGTNALTNATNSILLLTNISNTNAGLYCVTVTDACGGISNACATLTMACLPASSGLVGWWQAEGNAFDVFGTNNGVLPEGVGFTNGVIGQAFSFDGTDHRLIVPDSPTVNFGPNADFSIEAWVAPQNAVNTYDVMTIVDKRLAPYAGQSLGYEFSLQGGRLSARISDSITGNDGVHFGTAGPDLRDGYFHHVALTVQRNSSTGFHFYVDGRVVLEDDPTSQTGDLSNSEPFRIGNHATASFNSFFKGAIDEVALYNRALTAAEIRALYDSRPIGRCGLAPAFILQPTNQTAVLGNDALLVSEARGTSLYFQWFFNSNLIPGATAPSLTLPEVQTTNAGNYFVTVTNTLGAITSAVAMLTVTNPVCAPVPGNLISWWRAEGDGNDAVGSNTASLANLTFPPGKVGLAFSFDGASSYGFVPYSPSLDLGQADGLCIEAWIKPTDTLNPYPLIEWDDGWGDFGLDLWANAAGSGALTAEFYDSDWIYHAISSPPGVLTTNRFQHVALTYNKTNGVATLYYNGSPVASENLGSFVPVTSYDLYLGLRPYGSYDTPAAGSDALSPTGLPATNSLSPLTPITTLALSKAQGPNGASDAASDASYYGVFYAGLLDEVSLYNRALAPQEITAIYNAGYAGKCGQAPVIVAQPTNQSVPLGSNATFIVTATGTLPLSYQWRFNGTDLTGATGTTLTITDVQATDAGTYTVWVTNFAGAVLSSNAVLSLPESFGVFITQPSNNAVFIAPAVIPLAANVTPADGAQLVQFFTNLSSAEIGRDPISGSNPRQFAWVGVPPGDYTNWAEATALSGATAVSTAVVVHVIAPVKVSAGTNRTIILAGESVQLALEGSVSGGSGAVTSLWTQIDGAFRASLATPAAANSAVTFTNTGNYRFYLVAGDAASAGSDSVTISVVRNQAPVVDAGPNRRVAYSSTATALLSGSLAYGGWACAPTNLVWEFVKDSTNDMRTPPTIDDPASAVTTARNFAAPGVYKFRLSGSVCGLTNFDEMTVAAVNLHSRTYTRNVDFAEGSLLNVNYDEVPDQLQLNRSVTPYPYINIACSQRGTVARINVNNGQVVGEYRTGPIPADGITRFPSRTTVDKYGNVWVGNRDELNALNDSTKARGAIARIALVIGGTRTDGTANPDGSYKAVPNGKFLAPPFVYNTCTKNHNGLIQTSRGLGDLLDWGEDDAVDYFIVDAVGVRAMAIDKNNDIWFGGYVNGLYEKLITGTQPPTLQKMFTNSNFGQTLAYGALIDRQGVLWAVARGSGVIRYDTGTGDKQEITTGDAYGLGIDPSTGNVWCGTHGGAVSVLNPQGVLIGTYDHGNDQAQGRGLAVDQKGNVWIALTSVGVSHLRTDGTFVGRIPLPCTGTSVAIGVAIDANGKPWIADQDGKVYRINPEGGPVGSGGYRVGYLEQVVDLDKGQTDLSGPYNYSDMTGFVALGATSDSGSWDVVHDGGAPDSNWKIGWTARVDAQHGAVLRIECRATNSVADLAQLPFVVADSTSDGQALPGGTLLPNSVKGQYLEVRVSFVRGQNTDGSPQSPVLEDLTVSPDTADDIVSELNTRSFAVDDALEVSENTGDNLPNSLTVLTNDHGSGLSIVEVSPCQSGTVSNAISFVQYTPRQGFYGEDRFAYTVRDGADGLDHALVRVRVLRNNPKVYPPHAVDDAITIYGANGTPAAHLLDVVANDQSFQPGPGTSTIPDTKRIISVGLASHGLTEITSDADCNGKIKYTPAAGFTNGTDHFSYTIVNDEGLTDSATVTVTVKPPLALACGDSLNGQFQTTDPLLDDEATPWLAHIAAYEFWAVSGQKVTIQMTSSDFNPWLVLAGPPGFTKYGSSSFTDYLLDKTGWYTLKATSLGGDSAPTGSYQLALSCTLPAASLQALFNGQPLPSPWNWGKFATNSVRITNNISLKNIGHHALTFQGIEIQNNASPSHFEIGDLAVSGLNPGQTTALELRLVPGAAGLAPSATVSIHFNDGQSDQTFPFDLQAIISTGPVVEITSPVNNSFISRVDGSDPTPIPLAARVSVGPDSTVSVVRFYANDFTTEQQVGSDVTVPPYSTVWQYAGAPTTTFDLKAVATIDGRAFESDSVRIQIVPAGGNVYITAPPPNSTFAPPANFTVKARATVPPGTVLNSVTFSSFNVSSGYTDQTIDTNDYEYDWTWPNVAAGKYRIIASGQFDTGGSTVSVDSDPATIFVGSAAYMTSPTAQSQFGTGSSIPLQATVMPGPGLEVTSVEFYDVTGGPVLLGSASASVNYTYTYTWPAPSRAKHQIAALAHFSDSSQVQSDPITLYVGNGVKIQSAEINPDQIFWSCANIAATTAPDSADGWALQSLQFIDCGTGNPLGSDNPHCWLPSGKGAIKATATFAKGGNTEIVESDPLTVYGFVSGGADVVRLASPAPGARFDTNASIPFIVEAKAIHSATQVQFLNQGSPTPLGQSSTPIFSVPFSLSEGDYSFTAFANYKLVSDGSITWSVSSPAVPIHVGLPIVHNDPPVAVNDTYTVYGNSHDQVLKVTANDWDPDGDDLHIVGVPQQTSLGSVYISEDGKSLLYTPLIYTFADDTGIGPLIWPSSDALLCSCVDVFAPMFSTDSFYYTIEDSKGARAQALVEVTIQHDPPPMVSISSPTDGQALDVNQSSVAVSVVPDMSADLSASAAKLELFADGQKIGELLNPPSDPSTFTWNHVFSGSHYLQARLTDSAGAIGYSQPVTVTKAAKPGTHPPLVFIAQPQQTLRTGAEDWPDPAAQYDLPLIYAKTNVLGAVSDPDGNAFTYQFLLYQVDGSLLGSVSPEFSSATAIGSTTSPAALGLADLSRFADGVYDLELRAWDDNNLAATRVRIVLRNQLKIGQLTFSQEDLSLPGNNLPLSIVRTYDSYNPNSADFGYGWTFAINDLNVQLDEERMDYEDQFADSTSGDFFSLRVGGGRDVTLTLPDGRRTTFTYRLELHNYGDLQAYLAVWDAEPGVTATLTTLNPGKPGQDSPGDNTLVLYPWPYWVNGDVSVGIENYDFPGFKLTLQDGTIYEISREDLDIRSVEIDPGHFIYPHAYGKARLSRITLPDTSQILFGANSITKVLPGGKQIDAVLFQRDGAGRITAIFDPPGLDANGQPSGWPAMQYSYQNGNLVQVFRLTDRATGHYDSTSFAYTNTLFPHFITGITDSRGVPVAYNLYDENGRLQTVVDAEGNTTQFRHDTDRNVEVVTDRLNRTNSYVYDLRGNVIMATNPIGVVALTTYDERNLVLAETNLYQNSPLPLSWKTNAYDAYCHLAVTVDSLHTNLFLYETNGNLLSQTDPLGNIVSNRYDQIGNLTNVIHLDPHLEPPNQVVEQTFSRYENGRLVETRDGNGHITASYNYDPAGNMTGSTDANSLQHTFGYDASGRQTSSSFTWLAPDNTPVPVTTTTDYDAAGRVVRTLDPDQNETRTYYNALGKTDYTVDKLGNTNRFLYDARGNLIETTYPDGTFGRTAYDQDAKPVLAIDRSQLTGTRTDYDLLGRATNSVRVLNPQIDLQPDAAGLPHATVTAWGSPLSTNATQYYDNGWVKSRTNPKGQSTTYEYYDDGQVKSVTDALLHTTHYEYDSAGRQNLLHDARQHDTRFEYDALGRLIKTVYANATWTSNAFNNLGQRIGQIDQAGVAVAFGYNDAGQLTSVTSPEVPDPDHPGQTVSPLTSYQYDTYGRLWKSTDANLHSTTNTFDAVGRQLTRALPKGQTETNLYDGKGRLWKKIDFQGQLTQYAYDQYGRTRAKFYFASYQDAAPLEGVAYHYNQLGQLFQIVELRGEAVGNDPTDNYHILLSSGAGGMGGKMLASLNRHAQLAGGCLALPLLALGLLYMPASRRRQLLFVLRALSLSLWERARVRGIGRASAGRFRLYLPCCGWRLATYSVIIALLGTDPKLDYFGLAQAQCLLPPNASTENVRVTELAYDLEGRLAQVNCPEGVINYGYDPATGWHSSTCSTNSYVELRYDEVGRLQKVHALKRNGLPVDETTIYTYDEVGNRQSVSLPNGTLTTYLYDELNRLTNLTHQAGTKLLAQYSYQLHPTGRRTNAVEVLLRSDDPSDVYVTTTLSWGYDQMYRLTNELSSSTLASGQYTNRYVYDPVGNRRQKVHQTAATQTINYTYNENDQLTQEQVVGGGTTTYAYDANGSLTNKTTPDASYGFAYNLQNKLAGATVTGSGGTTLASYLYNDAGIRVRAVVNGTPKHYLVDANNPTGYAQVLEELAQVGGRPDTSYVIGDDVLAQCGPDGSKPSFLLYDGHGSTRQLVGMVNSAVHVSDQYNYDAYGIGLGSEFDAGVSPATKLLYCGEQFDTDIQMYNLRARYYDPSNGRFNQRDTYEGDTFDPQSLHKYAYASACPNNARDPSGNYSLLLDTLIASSIAVGLHTLYDQAVLTVGFALMETIWGVQAGKTGEEIYVQFLAENAIGLGLGIAVGRVVSAMERVVYGGVAESEVSVARYLFSLEDISYWDHAGGVSVRQAQEISQGYGFKLEIGRASRFDNARGVVIAKADLVNGQVNRIMLAEEIQHGIDKAVNAAGTAARRGVSRELFHAQVFQRILGNSRKGLFSFLTAEDLAGLNKLIQMLQ